MFNILGGNKKINKKLRASIEKIALNNISSEKKLPESMPNFMELTHWVSLSLNDVHNLRVRVEGVNRKDSQDPIIKLI